MNNKPTLILRKMDGENIERPQYRKWAKMLTEGKPLRLVTNYERFICLIPSACFPKNGGMPEGTLIVCYGGGQQQGYAELDFSKKPNPYYLNMRGFPIHIGTLICKTIYAMFPHLNPLSETDQETLNKASKTHRKQTRMLQLAAPTKKSKGKKVEKPEIPKVEHTFKEPEQTAQPAQSEQPEIVIDAQPVEPKDTQDHDNPTEQQKSAKRTRRKTGGTEQGTSKPRRRRKATGSQEQPPIPG